MAAHVQQWQLYGAGLEAQIERFAAYRAAALKVKAPAARVATRGGEESWGRRSRAGRRTSAARSSRSKRASATVHTRPPPRRRERAEAGTPQRRAVLNYIDGRRTLAVIRRRAEAETGAEIAFNDVAAYADLLKAVGWTR